MIKSSLHYIIENKKIAENLYKLILDAPETASESEPGQFVHINIPYDRSLLLRRPISIYNADKTNGRLELVYQVAGKGTKALSGLTGGEALDILGPLGNGFCPGNAKRICLVGGGCGVAPLRFIFESWPIKDYYTFLGYRSVSFAYDLHIFDDASKELYLASEDGSLGVKGFITEKFNEMLPLIKPDIILACGPAGMLKEIKRISMAYDVPCQISLEERMGCGVGGCLVCSCKIKTADNDWQYKRVCKDGPVFLSDEVIFDD